MNDGHRSPTQERWGKFSFSEQMANVGSEVERALSWRTKNNSVYSQKAAERTLELLDLTLGAARGLPRLREVARAREVFVDDLIGTNQHQSTEASWKKYFLSFACIVRKNR